MTTPTLPHQFVAEVQARLDAAVARELHWPRSQAQRAIEDGAVYVNGKRVRVAATRLEPGQTVRVEPAAPDRTGIDDGQVRVVHRDRWLLVVAKPAGLPTQPPPRGGDALSLRVGKLLGPEAKLGELHRLDRDVTGLVAYGLEAAATTALARQFRDHRARRRYLAIVRTAIPVPAQVVAEPIAERSPGRMTLDPTGMPARTAIVPLAFDPQRRLALVLAALETGRTHQVRIHLAHAVGPIVGDAVYGDPTAPREGGRLALHGAVLELEHPGDGKPRRWILPPDEGFWPEDSAGTLELPEGWAERDPRVELAT